jgi:optic atrophy 3 protein
MRLSVALLRNVEAEMRAKEKAEAPTVKTKEQVEKEEEHRAKHGERAKHGDRAKGQSKEAAPIQSIWKRKFRPLPEAKAVDLFADVVGDGFILTVAVALVIYEYWRSSQKPDANLDRIKDLNARLEELKRREEEREQAEAEQRQRFESLEEALRSLKDPRTKQPLLPTLQPTA